MPPGVQVELLSQKTKTELLALWRERFAQNPPSHLHRGLLVRLLAYKIQEQAYGGLKPKTQKHLRHLARKFASNPRAALLNVQRIKPGTRLVRTWGCKSHQVTALESSFEYAGIRYSSLSKIARVITGTRWSGPLFFGLKQNHHKAKADGQ
jgi:Protein of unknown function (DUF2924)